MLLPAEPFVLTKRFTSKEEKRRVVAVVYDPGDVSGLPVAFENHLNYYHSTHKGLPPDLAWGLAAYLNSSLVEQYFRLFNGHTQVNATDLRSLPYPALDVLTRLGAAVRGNTRTPEELDELLLGESA